MTDHPDDEMILDHFRQWLQDARAEAEQLAREPPSSGAWTEFREVGRTAFVGTMVQIRPGM